MTQYEKTVKYLKILELSPEDELTSGLIRNQAQKVSEYTMAQSVKEAKNYLIDNIDFASFVLLSATESDNINCKRTNVTRQDDNTDKKQKTTLDIENENRKLKTQLEIEKKKNIEAKNKAEKAVKELENFREEIKTAEKDKDKNTKLLSYAAIILGILSIVFIIVCKVENSKLESSLAKTQYIEISEEYITLYPGDEKILDVCIYPGSAQNKGATLTSSDNSIVKVSNFRITAVNPGIAEITVSQNGNVYDSCIVSVGHEKPESIFFPVIVTDAKVGRPVPITAALWPEDVRDTEIQYSTSDSSLAKVSGETINFLAEGTVVLTAKHKSTGLEVSQTIVITPVELESFSIDIPLRIKAGDSVPLTVVLNPLDTTDKEIEWSSSNSSVAAIEDGKLVAKKAGKATIKAVHKASKTTESIEVEVYIIEITNLKITSLGTLYIGDTKKLTATVSPSNASTVDLHWSSSNTSVATIEDGVLKAKKEGTTTITVKNPNTGIKDSIEVTVKAVEATSVKISASSKTVEAGESFSLTATILPANTTDQTITWTSSNTSIATVDKNGNVKTLKPGSVTITAKTSNGKKATCAITVKPAPVKVSNGFIKRPSGTGYAPVKINAPSNESVYVYFKCSGNSRNDFSMFVKAGTSCEVDAPLGTYSMYYASGTTWYGSDYKFGDNTSYYSSPSVFRFYDDGTYYYGTELTLYVVANGNMSTTPIPASQFPG